MRRRARAATVLFALLAASVRAASPQSPPAPDDPPPLLVEQPPEAFLRGAERSPATPLPDRAAILRGIAAGSEFLLAAPNDDGSWGSPGRPLTTFWSNPVTHEAWSVATTALVVLCLDEDPSQAARAATRRGLSFLVARERLARPSDWDLDHAWGAAYGLQALVTALRGGRHPELAAAMTERAAGFVDELLALQTPSGGWGYYDFDTLARRPSWATSFLTSVVLLALEDAHGIGVEVADDVRARGRRALERCRLPSGAYTYEVQPIPHPGRADGIDQLKGSLGRTQLCNLALLVAGSDVVVRDDLLEGLDAFFRHHRFLDVARGRPEPHEAYYQNSGYFYFFGHYYAALVLERLEPPERERYRSRLAREILKTQAADGSLWDFGLCTYDRCWGTAFGVLALRRTLPVDARTGSG